MGDKDDKLDKMNKEWHEKKGEYKQKMRDMQEDNDSE